MVKRFQLLLLSLLTYCVQIAHAQRVVIPADEQQLAMIDSNTLKWRNKLTPEIPVGDLNIYGFEENDIPIYADSVYAYRLSLLESEIPMNYNEFVRPYIDLYTIRRRKLSSKILAWSSYYFPSFEEALDKEKMPIELKYLAVIESALNPNATSPVGAAGMWQFMAPTGRMYGLKTTSSYDERRDVSKSTEAAIKYLRNSYRIYGDWLLVIASYNCGPGNVNKAIRKAGGVKNFWAVQQYLPRETRGYVPAFIAAAYMMNYAAEHNLYPSEEVEVFGHTDTIMVDNRFTFNQIAQTAGMTAEELKIYNPALKHGIIPFSIGAVAITLPHTNAIAFTKAIACNFELKQELDNQYIALNKLELSKIQPQSEYYKIKRGDQLASIARKYEMTVTDLKQLNNLKSNKIKPGQKLKVKRA